MAENSTLLEKLYELETELLGIEGAEQYAIEQILTPEIKAVLDEIGAEFNAKKKFASERIEDLKQQIKTEVLALGHTMEDGHYQFRWSKGRAGGWDGKMLDGMSKLIPELNAARKPDGDPTVTFIKKA